MTKITINNRDSKLKNFIFIFSIFLFFIFSVDAQSSPQFLVSWKTDSYVPYWYGGKVLAGSGSKIEMNFELVDGGRTADLSSATVRWYVDDELMSNEEEGLGRKSFSLRAPAFGINSLKVRIAVLDYKDFTELNKVVEIPVAEPEVAVSGVSYDNYINRGNNVFVAYPFFFNVRSMEDLKIDWFADGAKADGSGGDFWKLNLDIDNQAVSGLEIEIEASISSLLNQLETAVKSFKLKVR